MTARNFGNPGGRIGVGAQTDTSAYGAQTRANTNFDDREIAAWVFVSLCAVLPLAFVVLCIAVIRWFS